MRINQKHRQRGVATIEAAITMLLFFVLLFGTIEISRLVGIQQTLTDAAREGARLGSAPDAGTTNLPTATEIEALVRDFLRGNAVLGATVNVNQAVVDATGVEHTRVVITVNHNVIALQPLLSGMNVQLQGVSQMRNETSP